MSGNKLLFYLTMFSNRQWTSCLTKDPIVPDVDFKYLHFPGCFPQATEQIHPERHDFCKELHVDTLREFLLLEEQVESIDVAQGVTVPLHLVM